MPPSDTPISIVLPTYNRSEILPESIRSILNQTYPDFELIIVDDASTDETEEIVRGFDDERIRYIRHETNQGASAARNTGINRAAGDIIAFQDSDDVWSSHKLQRQVEVFRDAPRDIGVVYTGMWRIVEGERRYLPYPGVEQKSGDVQQAIMRLNFISTQMTAVRHECFEKVGLFDEDLQALVDWELWIRISKHYQFEFIDEPLVRAAVKPDSISKDRRQITQARERIVNKHYETFDRKSLANHLFFIGHGYIKSGEISKGRKYLKMAALTDSRVGYICALLLSLLGDKMYNSFYKVIKNMKTNLDYHLVKD